MSTFRKTSLAVALLCALPALALAQTAPAGAGSVGNFPVITVPPPPMTSVQNEPTAGADSTLWSNGIPGPQTSTISIPITSPSTPTNPPNPPVSCTPQTVPQTTTTACPAGDTGTDSQTCQVQESCPNGIYGAPVYGPPSNCQTVSQCSAPASCVAGSSSTTQTAQCPSGETVGGATGGATSFTQTVSTSTTCPAGPSGAPSTQTTTTPSVATECLPTSGGVGNKAALCGLPQCARWMIGGKIEWCKTIDGNRVLPNGQPVNCGPVQYEQCGPNTPQVPSWCAVQ